jgi:hypothetical protein
MKKLMLALFFALLGLAVSDAEARYRRCYDNCNPCEKVCEESCKPKCCKVDFVEEEACPEPPCCVRYVRVEEPALVTKHVSYSVACPTGCTAEEKAAGMMHAGETWNY